MCVQYFPKEFAKKWFPSKTRHVYLTNKFGKRWPLVWKPQDYKGRFNGGWKSFVEDNDIKEGDICWLELVNPIKLELQVHIFRIADYYNPKVVSDHNQTLSLCSPPENVCPKNIALDNVIILSQPLSATTATTPTTNGDDAIVGVKDPEVEGDLEHATNLKLERNPEKDSGGVGNVVAFDAAQVIALTLDRPNVIVMMRRSYVEKGYRLVREQIILQLINSVDEFLHS